MRLEKIKLTTREEIISAYQRFEESKREYKNAIAMMELNSTRYALTCEGEVNNKEINVQKLMRFREARRTYKEVSGRDDSICDEDIADLTRDYPFINLNENTRLTN